VTYPYPPVNDDLFAFEWGRDESGYVLVEEKPASAVLTGRQSAKVMMVRRKGGALKMYPPRAVRALHRIFAALPDDPEKVLEFVKQYGFLGMAGLDVKDTNSETVAEILACRDELRGVQDLVDATEEMIRALKRTASEMRDRGETVRGDPGEFTQIAGGLFNQFAKKHTGQFRLTIVPSRDDRGKAAATIRVRPRTLLSSFWLSTAEEITGGAKWRACAVCGTPMSIGGGQRRSDKLTCSDACRKMRSRKREISK